MKCIYCNNENDLTSSDIVSYGITGAKLTKTFVCREHNAFTNDNYEKEFINNLDFIRNRIGLTTRDNKEIIYNADLTIDGEMIFDIKLSGKNIMSLSKKILKGKDKDGKKVLLGDSDKLKRIKNGKFRRMKKTNAIVHVTINSEWFLGKCALHSIAKMAYEWHCYENGIEEYKSENSEIVNYILGKKENDGLVEIILDSNFYKALDYASSPGTNSFFEYDEDGYLYVVVNLWNTISYKVKLRQYDNTISYISSLHLLNIDGTKERKSFLLCNKSDGIIQVKSILPSEITRDKWDIFRIRFEKLLSTFLLSVRILNNVVSGIKTDLVKFQNKNIELDELLGFGDEDRIITIIIIMFLYINKSKYNSSLSFNENLMRIILPTNGTLSMTKDDKEKVIADLTKSNDNGEFVPLLMESIRFFEEIYSIEVAKRK